jgi:hypothetical protein
MFFSTLKTSLLFVTAVILPLHQPPDNCRSKNAESDFTHGVGYLYCFYFPGLEFIYLPEIVQDLPFQGRWDGRILKIVCFFENYIGTDDWQCRYMRGRCSDIRRTKQGRKTRPCGELFGTTECITL